MVVQQIRHCAGQLSHQQDTSPASVLDALALEPFNGLLELDRHRSHHQEFTQGS